MHHRPAPRRPRLPFAAALAIAAPVALLLGLTHPHPRAVRLVTPAQQSWAVALPAQGPELATVAPPDAVRRVRVHVRVAAVEAVRRRDRAREAARDAAERRAAARAVTVTAVPASPAPSPAAATPAATTAPAGGILTAVQVEALWVEAGGPTAAEGQAVTVATCESGLNPAAYNPSGATGLYQILGQVVPGNLDDPLVNTENAVSKYEASGDTWAQWTCKP